MHAFRKLIAVSAAAIVMLASGVPVAHGDSTPSVYTTPGGQISGGRLWNTSCEKYSSNVVRCHTNIWATTVAYENGRYVQRTGWTFNNLSYLPSPRASWATNNLGRTNPAWTSAGRQWRTECDTATTGQGGCRSYVRARVVAAVSTASGTTYVNRDAWVFNSLVLFSSSTVPAVSNIPPWIIDSPGQWLEPQGLRWGPIRVGSDAVDLQRLGYVNRINNDACDYWDPTQSVKNRGMSMVFGGDDLGGVSLGTGFIPTKAGARVGMTIAQVKALHGAAFSVEAKENYGETQYFGTVRDGAFELQFRVPGEETYAPGRPLIDADVVAEITAQRYTDDVSRDGC